MPIQAPKRKKIEAELGRSFESFLKEKLAEGLTPNRIGREVKLDPSTIRYYIKKFGLLHGRGVVKEKIERRTRPEKSRLVGDHVDICLCVFCTENCREMKMSHKQKRCVIVCDGFKRKSQS